MNAFYGTVAIKLTDMVSADVVSAGRAQTWDVRLMYLKSEYAFYDRRCSARKLPVLSGLAALGGPLHVHVECMVLE